MTTRAEHIVLAVLAAMLCVLGQPVAARADEPRGSISELQLSADGGSVVVLARGVSPQDALNPKSVTVTVNGKSLAATVVPGDDLDQELHRRVAVLVIDTSGSMSGTGLGEAKVAATAFLEAVPHDVQLGVVTFSDRARVLVPVTGDRGRARAAIAAIRAGGGTALYDGMRLASTQFDGAGERVLVVLSDGADTASTATQQQAVTAVRNADAVTRFVGLRTDGADSATLAAMAGSVGGKVDTASTGKRLSDAFSEAARSLDRRVALDVPELSGLAPGAHDVSVSLRFGTATVVVNRSLHVAAIPGRGETVTNDAAPVQPRTPWLLLTLVFTALLMLGVVLFVPGAPSRMATRMQQLEVYTVNGRVLHQAPVERHGALAQNVLRVSEDFIRRRGWTDRIALRLDRADLRLRPHEWIVIQAATVLAGAAVFGVLSDSLFAVVVGGLIAWLGAGVYLRIKGARRLKAFDEHLPDMLQLVASSLQTGFSLAQAFDAAAKDGRPPVSTELGRALNEARLGADLEDALGRVAHRMDSKDFHWAIMAIRIQRDVGGNLAEVLRSTVKTIRDRASLRRHVRALSAEGRLSMYILMALPIGIAVFLVAFRREYVSLLWTTGLGLMLTVTAVASMALGYAVMKKIVKVEV